MCLPGWRECQPSSTSWWSTHLPTATIVPLGVHDSFHCAMLLHEQRAATPEDQRRSGRSAKPKVHEQARQVIEECSAALRLLEMEPPHSADCMVPPKGDFLSSQLNMTWFVQWLGCGPITVRVSHYSRFERPCSGYAHVPLGTLRDEFSKL